MFESNIKEKHIRKDSWVKDLRKTFNPEMLSDLIKKRIDSPNCTGPYVNSHKGEMPTDIICAFMLDDMEYKEKITPAVGLLLYKMSNGIIPENHDVLRGVFSIIQECDLKECNKLVFNWLVKKHSIFSSNDAKWKSTFREGLMAFAKIQDKNPEMETWWMSIWRSDQSFWWPAAFLGLRTQNPVMAAKEMPLMISRNIDRSPYLLLGIWSDENSRSIMEHAIKDGLNANTGWAGFALNMLLEKLSDSQKDQLMLNLKRSQWYNR
jgi:hypothetical protein